ncbi:acyl-CoA thioesterase [Roseomonas sp. OT10]|uniref:acyl-CoA thioesterase n=1 Tax=Roseomonas cutis TaxID=2897332 RepID=UPI001E469043|nr:thioesterase family protein [Roseomonas sp. OT10]UFN48237.1 acyl-CoA thioesterase [Roseomonas sp. OT10]
MADAPAPPSGVPTPGASPAGTPPPGAKPARLLPRRAEYRYFQPITTRWSDNDAYGHVNNAIYYSWFDTTLSRFLLETGELDIQTSPLVGLAVESLCRYHAPVSFPETVTVGLRIGRIGNSSVRFELGIFRGEEDLASAEGHFVHVYVDRATQKVPQPLPERFRAKLAPLLVSPG